jgi:trans-enoyl reductase
MSLGRSFVAPVASAAVSGALSGVWDFGHKYLGSLPQRVVERITPKSGYGPSEATLERGRYTMETYTTTTTGARYVATIAQKGDCYKATAVLLGESALVLALDRDRLTGLRGVLTPAAAMGDALLERLPAAGVSIGMTRLS